MKSIFSLPRLSTAGALPLAPASAEVRPGLLHRADIRNVGLLLFGYLLLLLFVSPVRAFPINDDWAFAQSVSSLLQLNYTPHNFLQPTTLGHVVWGALASLVFGQSFTLLALVNLVMAFLGVALFYLLLRRLAVSPSLALLGCALLALNPIYLYVSYSYMTDVTFLVYLLLGTLAYMQGLTGGRERWLWLGSMAVAFSYLTRQPGILLAIVALAYMWCSGGWSWRRAIAIGGIPLLTFVVYALWVAGQPSTTASMMVSQMTQSVLAKPLDYAFDHMKSAALVLATAGLCFLPLVRLPRRPLLTVLVFAVLESLKLGFVFLVRGNLLSYNGLLMFDYLSEPLWPQWAWFIISTIGTIGFALYITPTLDELPGWIRRRAWREPLANPVAIPYMMLALLVCVTFVVSLFVFDRYLLPLLPLMMLVPLRSLSAMQAGSGYLSRRWLVFLPLVLFFVIGQRDYMEHATVRWQAAESLASQGIKPDKIDGGFEWVGWYLFDKGVSHIRETGDYSNVSWPPWLILDREYVIGDIPEAGYAVIARFPYKSWLNGGQERFVLVTQRQ